MLTDLCQALEALLTLLFGGLISYAMIYLFFLPMNRVRDLYQVGYSYIQGPDKRKRMWINRLRQGRKIGRTPPPFPNGWFVIMESRDLQPGDLKYISIFGLNLAVFRGKESKKAYVTSAYCPHLGADLTVGGQILGDCVECPFHKWSFDGDTGKCSSIPYVKGDKVPDFVQLKTYSVRELNELVYIWHHVDDEEPTWEPEVVPELMSDFDGKWVYQGRNEFEVACHIQDIPENGADVNHLPAVHKASIMTGGEPSPWLESMGNLLSWHEWSISWKPGSKEEHREHLADVSLKHCVKVNLFGKELKTIDTNVRAVQIGPGCVHLYFDVEKFGRGVMLQYVQPLEPYLQRLVHVFYTERSFLAPLAKFVLYGESVLVERDIRVWNSKTYADHPVLVKEDQAIRKHRNWYSQFYSGISKNKNKNSKDQETQYD